MRAALAATLFVATIVPSSAARADHDAVLVDRARVSMLLTDLLEDLARLEGLAAGGTSCRRVGPELSRVRASLRSLNDDLRAAPSANEQLEVTVAVGEGGFTLRAGGPSGPRGVAPPPPAPEPIPAPPTVAPMTREDFQGLLQALDGESFSDGRIRVLREAAGWGYFSTAQVVAVLAKLDFGTDKLKALDVMAPRIYDPENSFKIYRAFDFDSDKKKAKRILEKARD